MRPAYCIARRPPQRQILLVICGTKSLGDAVTILTGATLGCRFGADFLRAGRSKVRREDWLL